MTQTTDWLQTEEVDLESVPEVADRIRRFSANWYTHEIDYLTIADLRSAYLELNDYLQTHCSHKEAADINEKYLKPSYQRQKEAFEV